jgi:biotin carboxyl carrier protein
LSGQDLQTNASFHHGILAWLATQCAYPRVPTHVVASHLRAVAHVAHLFGNLDLEHAWQLSCERILAAQSAEGQRAWEKVFATLHTFTLRPLLALQSQPHLAYAWVCHASRFLALPCLRESEKTAGFAGNIWQQNPMAWLSHTLFLLGWLAPSVFDDRDRGGETGECRLTDSGFWSEDFQLLQNAQAFYQKLKTEGVLSGASTEAVNAGECWDLSCLANPQARPDMSAQRWLQIRQAHSAYAFALGFWQWTLAQVLLEERLPVSLTETGGLAEIPEWLVGWELREAQAILAPPPAAPADEIVAVSGGLFYGQERPGSPPFVSVGQRFQRGDVLYIIEVMKMFNPVKADCDGQVEAVLVSGMEGVVVRKGQPLFKIKPDDATQDHEGGEVPLPPSTSGAISPEALPERISQWFGCPQQAASEEVAPKEGAPKEGAPKEVPCAQSGSN